MSYELFCQSVQGAGHIEKGMPCEDYGIKFENEICKIFALGDGHGDSNCPRSSFGSRSVCEIAVDELQLFAKEIKNQKWEEQLMDKYGASELVNQLVTSIFGKWSCRVNEDFAQNPLSEKEETEAKDYIERYRRGERIEHIYGTTFIAALLTDEYLLLLQQGDGRCVVFDYEGNASQPIPWDDRCFANVTTSVCDVDAVPSCRYHIIDLKQNPIIACVAGSDGVEDSFGSMDKMYAYYRSKLQIACESGVEELERHLAETLPSFSAEGSKDDITICGVIDRALFNDKLDKLIADNEVVIVNDAINKAQEHIKSMEPKLSFLQKKCSDALAKCSSLRTKSAELDEEYFNIKKDLESYAQNKSNVSSVKNFVFSSSSVKCLQRRMERIREEKEEIAKEIQVALEKKRICDDEYNAYKQKYDGYVGIVEGHEAKIKILSSFALDQIEDSSHEDKTGAIETTDSIDSGSNEKSGNAPSDVTPFCVEDVQIENVASVVENLDSSSVDVVNDSECEIVDIALTAVAMDVIKETEVTTDNTTGENALAVEGASLKTTDTNQIGVTSSGETSETVDETEKKSKTGFFSNFKKSRPKQ